MVPYATGGSADITERTFGVAAGDVNRDGALDLVASFGGNPLKAGGVSVFLCNGDGTFKPKLDVPGAAPGSFGASSITLADMNGDGTLDIVVASGAPQSVSIFLGNGDGTFQSSTTNPPGPGAVSIAVSDLDNDGKLDVVTASGGINILLGNGDGTLRTQPNLSIPGQLGTIASADLNRDGKADVIAGTLGFNNQTVSVFLGNGDGAFQPRLDVAAGPSPEAVAVSDVNGDGTPDLVVGGPGGVEGISVLFGNGDGTFAPRTQFPGVFNPLQIAIVDVDGDGVADVVAPALNGGRAVYVLLGQGDGTFPFVEFFGQGGQYFGLAVADLNGDAKLDIARRLRQQPR